MSVGQEGRGRDKQCTPVDGRVRMVPRAVLQRGQITHSQRTGKQAAEGQVRGRDGHAPAPVGGGNAVCPPACVRRTQQRVGISAIRLAGGHGVVVGQGAVRVSLPLQQLREAEPRPWAKEGR